MVLPTIDRLAIQVIVSLPFQCAPAKGLLQLVEQTIVVEYFLRIGAHPKVGPEFFSRSPYAPSTVISTAPRTKFLTVPGGGEGSTSRRPPTRPLAFKKQMHEGL
jgi:hypothetical protein